MDAVDDDVDDDGGGGGTSGLIMMPKLLRYGFTRRMLPVVTLVLGDCGGMTPSMVPFSPISIISSGPTSNRLFLFFLLGPLLSLLLLLLLSLESFESFVSL